MLFQNTSLARALDTTFRALHLQQLWFCAADFRLAQAYSVGLIVHPAKRAVFQVLSHSTGVHVACLSDFLNPDVLGWSQSVLFDSLIRSLPPGGELIVDQFVIPKLNTHCMEARKVHSSCLKRIVDGQAFSLLVWTLGERTLVIGCDRLDTGDSLYEVTLSQIRHALELGLQVKRLLADGDYCKLPLIKAFRQLKLPLVSKVRRDTSWYVGVEYWQLKAWAETVEISGCHYYPGFGYAKGVVIAANGCAPCKLVLVRPKRSSPKVNWLFLLSSDVTLSVAEILRARSRRWRIEVTIRDSSQQLGLKQHQGQLKTSNRHVLMSFLAYNFLSEHKARFGRTIGVWRRAWAKAYELERTSGSALPALPTPFPAGFQLSS